MPRKYKSFEHYLQPDPKYHDRLASKFINCLMWDGKKSIAQRIFYSALDVLKDRFPNEEPIDVFRQAVNNVKPHMEVRSKRVGGATYQVPMQVSQKRQTSLALRWIIESVRNRSGRPSAQFLADELTDAFRKEGTAMKKRENVHKMADANKAFSHFAWGR